MEWKTHSERLDFLSIWNDARRIVCDSRAWFCREYNRYDLHPAVEHTLNIYRPDDWQQLLLEWPHKSKDDSNRIAFTQNERKGESDIQTATTIGRYLTRQDRKSTRLNSSHT